MLVLALFMGNIHSPETSGSDLRYWRPEHRGPRLRNTSLTDARCGSQACLTTQTKPSMFGTAAQT